MELGYTPDDIAKGRDYRMKLNDGQVMLDVEAAAAYLGAEKLGIVGDCFGGTVAWWDATRTTKFAAAVCWYVGGIAATKDERPNCPVQMHFGEKDASTPMSRRCGWRSPRPRASFIWAPGTGSAATSGAASALPDYALAQQRTLDFFARNLG